MTTLIDTHQHLVYPDVAGYGWTDGIPALANQPFTLEHYNELTASNDIVGTLFMETGVDDADYKAEARFVAKQATDPDNKILGIIASCRPEEAEGYSQWLDECDTLGVVGYRRILHVMDNGLSTTDTFRRNIRELGKRDKPFDLCILPAQLKIGMDLIKACDNTTFVLNHCGVPNIAGEELDSWRDNITAMAALPNVYCKLSGLLAYCAPGEATAEAITPYIDHVLTVFGPSRMVWGSDWPVVNMANGLPDWLNVTNSVLEQLSDDEANEIGSLNAKRLFQLS